MPRREPTLSFRMPEVERKHTVLHIPGSHTLFVGPSACMRRHALGQYKHGNIEDVSFLRVTQADVVSGTYEELIVEAAGELVATLSPAPSILFVDVFCIDDFLGTDDEALVRRLEGLHPGTRFVFNRIHPVATNEKVTMGDAKQVSLYSFLDPVPPEGHDNGVNMLGNFVPLNPESEIFELFARWGLGPVRQLFACETYAEYQDMAKSRVAVVARFSGDKTAREMEGRLGIPYVRFPACYDLDRIEGHYRVLARTLGEPEPDFSPWRGPAEEAVRRARELLGDTPIVVDNEGTLLPYMMARSLLGYGFNVTHLFHSHHLFDPDVPDREAIKAEHPELFLATGDDARLHVANVSGHFGEDGAWQAGSIGPDREPIAIGTVGARIVGARRVVDVWHDEGLTGFHGVRLLMEKLCEQYRLMEAGTERASSAGAAGNHGGRTGEERHDG